MAFGKVCGLLVVLGLAATGTAMGRDIVKKGPAGEKGNPASLVKPASLAKGDKSTSKSGPAVAVRHVKPQAPIVMGRSVSVHRNTKLHHVKIKPLDSSDTPVSADVSADGS